MGLQTYQLVAGDWIGLERIINDLTGRVVGQTIGTTSSPVFAGLTLTGLSGVLQATAGVLSGDADHNSLGNIQGGTTDEYYHLTSAEYSGLGGFISEEVDPVFTGVLAGLTANRLIYGGTAGALTSVSNLASWIAGTSNRVTVTDDTDGTITLSGPQDLAIASSPTFAGLFLSGAINASPSFNLTIQTPDQLVAFGGNLLLHASSNTYSGGDITVTAGDLTSGDFSTHSGTISLTGGNTDFDANGGDVNISGGNSTVYFAGVGGNVNITSGTGVGSNGVIKLNSLSGLLKGTSGVVSAITDNSANWDTAYTDRLKWDGGATGLVVATGRTSLGLGIADTPSFTGLISGVDAATNTAGTLKLWSAGANNYSTLFTAGTQTADATYTLPTAMPASTSKFLQSTTGGVLSWETVSTATPTIDAVLTAGSTSVSNSLTLTAGVLTASQGLFNQANADVDFQVGTTVSDTTLTVDAGKGDVYIASAVGEQGGFGTTSPSATYKFHFRDSIVTGVDFTRLVLYEGVWGDAADIASPMTFKLTTSVNMTDGFGPGFLYAIQDDAGVENFIARTAAYRNGADNTGAFRVDLWDAGTRSQIADFKVGTVTISGIVTGTYFQTSTAITANSSGTVAIAAKDANLLTNNAGWMPIKKSDGTVVYVPYWA